MIPKTLFRPVLWVPENLYCPVLWVQFIRRMGHGMGRRFAGGAPVAVFGGSPVGNAPKSAETALPAGLPPRSETGEEYINKTHKDS